MQNIKTREITISGILGALICVATMFFQIQVPATDGYIHLGDSMIFIASAFLSPLLSFLSAGIGSLFADIFSSYAHWAIFTFMIKGAMGYIISYGIRRYKARFFYYILSCLVMVIGYLLGGTILKGDFLIALTSVPANIIQGVCGMIIGALALEFMHKRVATYIK